MKLYAESATALLGGQWSYTYGTAPCPVCQPEGQHDQNALTLTDGDAYRLLLHCKKSDCDYHCIRAELAKRFLSGRPFLDTVESRGLKPRDRHAAETKLSLRAYEIWKSAIPIAGTCGEVYLRNTRGIKAELPGSLRFLPAIQHPNRSLYPAIVAEIVNAQRFAIHRTYLSPTSFGKADVSPNKAMLGAARGGAVFLRDAASGPIVVCEGIETGLSLASGLVAQDAQVWASLSTSGMKGLKLPNKAGHLIIATDGDDAGVQAGNTLAQRAHRKGWKVELLPAPDGQDWNDVLLQEKRS